MSGALEAASPQRTPPWVHLVIALLAVPPAIIAVVQLGRMHPDEVFQMLQPAHHFAFGQGALTWEWDKGLRNWLVPGALGCALKLAAALGADDPIARRIALEVPQYALHAVSLAAVYRLVRRRLSPELPRAELWSLAGVALIALYAPVLHFAGRTMSESFSTALLLCGFERADTREDRPRVHALAGFLLGLAVIARYGSIVFAFATPLYLFATQRRRAALYVVLGGALAACVLAILDLRASGVPFRSAALYFDYNVFSGKGGEANGKQPWWFLWSWALRAFPAWAWAALAFAGYRAWKRQARAAVIGLLVGPTLLYLVALSLPSLKEERFLYPALVMLLAAIAPAWIRELSAQPRVLGAGLLALSLASGLALLTYETRFSPRGAAQFRMFVRGIQTGEGVVLTHSGLWGTPGDFYAAGKPWVLCATPQDRCTSDALRSKRFDRVVTFKDEGAKALSKRGLEVIEEQRPFKLWATKASIDAR